MINPWHAVRAPTGTGLTRPADPEDPEKETSRSVEPERRRGKSDPDYTRRTDFMIKSLGW